MKQTTKELKIQLHWSVWLALLMLLILTFINLESKKEFNTITTVIELNNRNVIIEHVNIINLFCDDTVKIDRIYSNIIPFWDYAYLTTWNDGKIPNSNGKCYVKYKVRVK